MRGTHRSVLMSFTKCEAKVVLESLEASTEYFAEFGESRKSVISDRVRRKLSHRAEHLMREPDYDENLDV